MKFEQTQYAKLWSAEGRAIMHTILQNPDLIKPNFGFWKTQFRVDPEITPSDNKGVANFISYMRETDTPVMMDMRAPLGDTNVQEKNGGKFYTGSIPDYSAKGYVETAMERMAREQMMDEFADAKWLAEFAIRDLQRMNDQANMTLSYQSAMLLSTGKLVYKQGEGIQTNIHKAEIPEENFKTAGKQVWSDPSANIISQMIKIQDDIAESGKVPSGVQFKWQINKKMWQDVFMKNKQVLEWANNCRTIETGGIPMPSTYSLLSEDVRKYLSKYEGLAEIEVVEESQRDVNNGLIHGWVDTVAVYRPVGYAGYMRRSTILDSKVFEKYANKVNTYTFVEALGGLGQFMNSVVVNGVLKEWHTDLFMKAVPTLDEFLYHFIINTAEADE